MKNPVALRFNYYWINGSNFIFLLAGLFFIETALASNLAPNLFTWTSTIPDAISQQLSLPRPEVKRSHFAQLHLDRMASVSFQDGADRITLNLFDDVLLTAIKDRLERRSLTDYSWFGHIADAPHNQVILTVEQGSMAGSITVEGEHYGVDAIYQIRPAPGGLHEIRQIDQNMFQESSTTEGKLDYIPVTSPKIDLLPNSQADDGSTIDVMVVYTDSAAAATTNISAEIQLGVDETNQSYINSGINQRIRLVHKAQISYAETGTLCNGNPSDLERLQGKTDGYLDSIHNWRNTYAADIVSLWVENGGGFCGCGYFMNNVSTAFAENAFNVVARGCATGYYSFGHEMGHNMGAMHDWYVDNGINPYPYAHGYANTTNRWRTIMAYNNACNALGFNCTRIKYWSNPSVTYQGSPTGVAEGQSNPADNRKTLNNTAYTVANFRASSIITHSLTLTKAGNGNGTISGGGNYAAGTTVTLTATPDANSTFAGWSPSPCAPSFTMPANNLTCTATFNLSQSGQPDLIVTTVTSPSTGVAGGSINVATTVKNQGTQAAGLFWAIYHLSSDSTITPSDISTSYGCSFSSLAAGASSMCSGSIVIPASVAPGTYYLGLYADPDNAISESSETNNGSAATNQITITGSGSLLYLLTVAKAGTGAGSVASNPPGINCGADCSESYTNGTSVTLTATPAAGSTFDGWSGACSGAGACTVTMNMAKSVNATFSTSPSGPLRVAGLNSAGQIYYTTNLTAWVNIPGQLSQLVTGHFNGDSQTDLAGVASNGSIWYSTNRSTWTQIPGQLSQLVTGHFNGDSQTDLAGVASNGSIWYSTNRSTWTQIPGQLSQLVTGHFNGDSQTDLAGVASNGSIWYSTNRSTWTQIPGQLSQLVTGDFNGDSQTDLAGVASNGSIWYSTNRSTWTQIPGQLSQLVTGHFNGDSQTDLAGVASNGSIWYSTNRSTWTQIPGQLSQLVTGHFNGDSQTDLAGVASNGTVWYTIDRSTWINIPGQLNRLAGDTD